MSSRREELIRQRALLEAHLAWLNREIEAESGTAPARSPTPVTVPTPPSSIGPATRIDTADTRPAEAAGDSAADQILAQYQTDPLSTQQEIRRGCMTLLGLALALLAAVVILAYVFYRPKIATPTRPAPKAVTH